AEDGIRDFHVTGVQTCALPIWGGVDDPWGFKPIAHERGRTVAACLWRLTTPIAYLATVDGYASPFWHSQEYFDWMLTMEGQTSRSEERRVGKECRRRGSWARER